MATVERALVRFLAEYEARVNRALADERTVEVDATSASFTRWFVAANPDGVVCRANDEEFRSAIPKGFEFYRSIGTRMMRIASIGVTELDPHHAMAKVRWHSVYEKRDSSEVRIDFDVIYLFHMKDAEPKIFGYITGDEDAVLRAHGLIGA
jgi:hypothetical protein